MSNDPLNRKSSLRVSLIQMDSTDQPDRNLARIGELMSEAAASDLIVLPEVCLYRGAMHDYAKVAEPLDGPMTEHIAGLSRRHDAWVLLGSFPERDGPHVFNTAVLFNPAGERVARYRKVHLFGASLASGTRVDEAQVYRAGEAPVAAALGDWQAGLSICYDLRFPEYFRALAQTDLTLVPSDFTAETGRAHWEVLCRARAIENQCYLIAANQCGHNRASGTASYGHSMIVDPWGEVLAEAEQQECVLSATLQKERIQAVRQALPALRQRRL